MESVSPSPNRIIKRRNKKGSACTHCRQLKFKCDAAERFPSPCTRCANAKDGRQCTVDPSFRRTANKQRLDSLEQELQKMRQELRHRQSTPSTTSTPRIDPASVEATEILRSPEVSLTNIVPQTTNEVTAEIVNGIELLPNVIMRLIEEFYAHFHPHFPILPDQAVFFSRYNFNKLLLWTVLAIASKGSAEHANLYQSLVDPVRRLAGDLYGSQSRSFETVQALLLLCVWPFPFQQTINDPSPMYIALATQIAYQLGLHRPAFRADFTENNIPQADPGEIARKKAWFACVIVNQFVTTKLGTPSTIKPGYAVLAEVAEGSLSSMPEPLISQLHLANISNKALSALGDHEYTSSGILPNCLATVRAFESEFMQISQRFRHRWGIETQILYLAELIHLYSFALDSSNLMSQLSQADVGTTSVYAKAYNTVLELCRLAVSGSKFSNSWPVLVKYAVMYGMVFATPLANIQTYRSPQREELVSAIREGVAVMKSWSMFEKDHFSRVAAHVDWLNRKIQQADQGQPSSPVSILGVLTTDNQDLGRNKKLSFAVKSRMATNIMYEAIWTAKHGAKSEEQARNQTTAMTVSGTSPSAMANTSELHMTQDQLSIPGFNPAVDDFVFTDGWDNSGFLDIFADWQGLIGSV